jgi:hypothetical protein
MASSSRDGRADFDVAAALSQWSDPDEPPSRRSVIVAVGSPDRRVVAATRCAARVPAAEHRALHVATNPADAHALGLWWMDLEPDGLRLEIVENRGGIAATIAAGARAQLAAGYDRVLVLVGHLPLGGVARALLHDQTALAVCAAVNRIPGAISALVPVHFDS